MHLVNINCWRGKKFPQLLNFLEHQCTQPNTVITLQELEEHDATAISSALGLKIITAPMHHRNTRHPNRLCIGIMTNMEVVDVREKAYGTFNKAKREDWIEVGMPLSAVLLCVDIACGQKIMSIGTTHFTWTARPIADKEQFDAVTALTRLIEEWKIQVLACDLNSPRKLENGMPGKIWSRMTKYFYDGIHPDIETTLDPIHAASHAGVNLVVDGVFFTPNIDVYDVRLHGGVSDHLAITATVEHG